MGDRTYYSYQSVERRPVTVEVFGPIAVPIATAPAAVAYDLMDLPIGTILADAILEVKTAVVHAGTCTLDLRTDAGSPYEWMSAVDAESAALTRLGTGVIRRETAASKLQLYVENDGTNNVTTAGELWVVVSIIRRDY
jgi:hypothetical protein